MFYDFKKRKRQNEPPFVFSTLAAGDWNNAREDGFAVDGVWEHRADIIRHIHLPAIRIDSTVATQVLVRMHKKTPARAAPRIGVVAAYVRE